MTLLTYPMQDNYKTKLSRAWSGGTGTVYVRTAPSFTMPASSFCIVTVDPGTSKEQAFIMDTFSVANKTLSCSSIAVNKGPGLAYTQKSHSVGAKVIISDCYGIWEAIKTALDLKMYSNVDGIYMGYFASKAARDASYTSPVNGKYFATSLLEGVFSYYIGGQWIDVPISSTSTTNASETVSGKVEISTLAQMLAGTDTGETGAYVSAKNSDIKTGILDKFYSLPMVAGEDLTAGNLVYADIDTKAYKTVRKCSTLAQVGSVTGLDTDVNVKMLKCEYLTDNSAVILYKKSGDNIAYATVVTFLRGAITPGTEVAVSSALSGTEGPDLCVLSPTLFIVGFVKASDSKPYATACTVATTTITAGTEVKMYDSETVESNTSVSVAKASATTFVMGVHNTTSDDPLVVAGSISGTTITAGSAVQVEAVTMNASGSVKLCYAQDNVLAIWYDDGTNIKMNQLTLSGTTITAKTAMTTSIAGYIATGDNALFIEYGRFLLVRNGTSSITRIITVNVADQSAWTVGVLAGNYTLPNDWNTAGSILASATYLGRNKLAIVNQTVLGTDARFRVLDLGYNDAAIIFDATIAGTVGDINLCKLTTQQDKVMIVWRETGTTNLAYSLYRNTENQLIGSVLTTTSAAGTVPITVDGPTAIGGLTAGLPYYVGDAGAVATSGTKQIGVALTTSSLLLR